MKKYFKYYALVALTLLTFSSCDEVGDDEVGGTVVKEMAGDWYVKLTDNNGNDVYDLGYKRFTTYNSSSNTEEMWVDDNELWPMKVKVTTDSKELTFGGIDLENQYSESISVTITNGAIFKDGTLSTGGNVTDSIRFDVEYSDAPGTIFTVLGYKRTGFPEDEH